MKIYWNLILFFVVEFSSSKTNGQQVDNTKPMYGEVQKNEELHKIDEEFKKNCLLEFKTIDSAVYVHIDHAWRYFHNNDLKTSMKRFNQAWLLNPEFPDSYFGFAALSEMKKDRTEAERFYKIGIEKDKGKQRTEICYQIIADCKEQLNDITGTIDTYTRITIINPRNALAFKKIGYLQMNNNSPDDAIKAFRRAIELDPNDAMTYNNRAYLYQTKKEYSKAIADYTKAIELDSKYISAYVNRGITESLMGNNKGAKKDFEICVQLEPKSGELRRFLALCKLNLADKSGACKDFGLAKKLGDSQSDELIKQNCK